MVSHSLNNNTRTGLFISLCLKTNPLVSLMPPPPRIASNFRHLLSCGTIARMKAVTSCSTQKIDQQEKDG